MKTTYVRSDLDPQLVTIAEAAALLSVAPMTLRKWYAEGRLPVVKLGRAVRVRLADIEKIVQMGLKTKGQRDEV